MAPRSEDPKLIIRVINFELVQPSLYAQDTTTLRMDRRTDDLRSYDSNTALALRASCGKNVLHIEAVSLRPLKHVISHRYK